MKKTRILFTLALFAASLGVSAEESGDSVVFNPHWFVGARAGAQYTLGEASFGDLISPAAQISAGYRFNPWLSLRLAVDAWQSKGGYCGYVGANGKAGTKTYKYNYVAPAIDVMFNLSNAVCGYNPDRVFNLTAFLGGGANIGFSNSEANRLAAEGYVLRYNWTGTQVLAVGRGGLDLDFRLSDRVSLGLEGSANILSDKYNSKKAGNPDWYFNVMAGVTINLGKTRKTVRRAEPVVPAEPVEQPTPQPVEEPAPQPAPQPETMQRDVFFKINSSVISASEQTKVKELAGFLESHPEATVEITGYADAGTGTAAINERLSTERAESVKKMLVEELHIDASRIRTDHKGSTVQPFAENDKNRVSICVTSH